jgi:hypothetical protein
MSCLFLERAFAMLGPQERLRGYGFNRSGRARAMPLLLVDDRDGRVLKELETEEEAVRLLECLASEDSDAADSLCIVALDRREGELMACESSVTIRPLLRS